MDNEIFNEVTENDDGRRWVKGGFWFVNEYGDEEFIDSDDWEDHIKK